MKYDCTKILDYAHEQQRYCDSFEMCSECSFDELDDCCKITKERIEFIQKWSDQHKELDDMQLLTNALDRYKRNVHTDEKQSVIVFQNQVIIFLEKEIMQYKKRIDELRAEDEKID